MDFFSDLDFENGTALLMTGADMVALRVLRQSWS